MSSAYWDAPIPRKYVMAMAVGQGVVTLFAALALKQADEVIKDQEERLKIFKESTDFLLENADDSTIVELNKSLDFWRVVRNMPVNHITGEES